MACNCDLCTYYRSIFNTLEKEKASPVIRELVEGLLSKLMNTEEDLEQCNAVFAGSWPGSQERLQKALDKIPV
jgi:hypothetical protein